MGLEVQEQLALAAIITHAVEWMKRSPWFPGITIETKTLVRVIGAVGAFVSAAGVKWVASGSWSAGGSLVLSWPPADQMLAVVTAAVSSWAMQEVFYQTTVKPTPTQLFFTRRAVAGNISPEGGTNGDNPAVPSKGQ